MNLTVKGKGQVTLDKKNFLAQGGQGAVYVKGSTAYKIYFDAKAMIPEQKIKELSVLTQPNIIKPDDMLIDDKNHLVGYTMKYIKKDSVFTLCELFSQAFKNRNQVTPKNILNIVKRFQETVEHCHTHKIILVDINELNFLVAKKYDEIYFIDTDSYQTDNFPATVIMDNIRDRHNKGRFNIETDWFSFGILTFQLFTGMHPYKGKHPTYKTLDDRMIHNLSILNKDVTYPAMVGDVKKIIPANYYNWYEAMFEKGMRCNPPKDGGIIITAIQQIKIITSTDNFVITLIKEYQTDIVKKVFDNVILTTQGLYLGDNLLNQIAPYAEVVKDYKSGHIFSFIIKDNRLKMFNCTLQRPMDIDLYATEIMSYESRIYVKQNEFINEVSFMNAATGMVEIKRVANILENSTQLYDGCAIQNLLGTYFVSIFPKEGMHLQYKLNELNKFRVLSAKYDNYVLIVVAEQAGIKKKFIYKLSQNPNDLCYDIRIIDTDNININFVTLDNGVCLHMNGDKLELFSNKLQAPNMKVVENSQILENSTLFKQNNTVFFSTENKLYSIQLK